MLQLWYVRNDSQCNTSVMSNYFEMTNVLNEVVEVRNMCEAYYLGLRTFGASDTLCSEASFSVNVFRSGDQVQK